MNYRHLGRTGWQVSEVSYGTWAIGGTWGTVRDEESLKALHRAVDLGINFFDTADKYGDGRSEKLLAQLKRARKDEIVIATKAGRRLDPHIATGYNEENLTAFVERSLANLEVDALDILQLHTPPWPVYYMPEVFEILDGLVSAGKIRYYGVSVDTVEQGLKAIEYPNVQTVQIIYNMFRQRPAERFFDLAKERGVGILARVPLASGLLTGKFTRDSQFEADDHRAFNREGKMFDRGETFAGVDFETGLQVVERLRSLCPDGLSLAQFALCWILSNDAVSCAIPGGKRSSQIEDNAAASDAAPLSADTLASVREIYDAYVRRLVHHRW